MEYRNYLVRKTPTFFSLCSSADMFRCTAPSPSQVILRPAVELLSSLSMAGRQAHSLSKSWSFAFFSLLARNSYPNHLHRPKLLTSPLTYYSQVLHHRRPPQPSKLWDREGNCLQRRRRIHNLRERTCRRALHHRHNHVLPVHLCPLLNSLQRHCHGWEPLHGMERPWIGLLII
jgi:hypothetical protein